MGLEVEVFANWATIIGVPVGIGGVWFAAFSLRAQRKSNDVASILELSRDLDMAWERYLSKNERDDDFEFGQILVLYETACYLFNHNLVGMSVQSFMKDHIIEILAHFFTDDQRMARMNALISDQKTFCELTKFREKYNDEFLDHVRRLKKAKESAR